MAHLQYFTYPDFGVVLGDQSYYSQAVRIGDRIECSGQGGWNPTSGEISTDLAAEVERAFANVELALKTAGGQGWSQVYKVNLFYLELTEELGSVWRETMAKWCPDHRPILTATAAASLAVPGMHVEIEVAADLAAGGTSQSTIR
ncbi:YjgF-like protein [Apiospora kogelbergensis]|uniref:YjgF-like protein n=1 Tax=Apiospora kogelbergensis TaxID=1337665 RepID=UPI003131BC93